VPPSREWESSTKPGVPVQAVEGVRLEQVVQELGERFGGRLVDERLRAEPVQ
jgi:hypothetical protein